MLRNTDTDLRNRLIVCNFPSGDLQWEFDVSIEADGSSKDAKITCDWPEILLDPAFLFAEEIENGDVKEHIPDIVSLNETLKLACKENKQETPKSLTCI